MGHPGNSYIWYKMLYASTCLLLSVFMFYSSLTIYLNWLLYFLKLVQVALGNTPTDLALKS